ncbi:unnamed protein product, partial [Acanthocheilonema viteae]
EQWEDEQNMNWTDEQEPLSYNSRPKLIHSNLLPMRRHYDDDGDDDDDDDDDGDIDNDGGGGDDDDMMWHDYPTVIQNKLPTATGQYDMPPSESEHQLFTRHHMKESDDHASNPNGHSSIHLPNGSIGPFNNKKYDPNKQYSSTEKQQMENDLNEAKCSFEHPNKNETQSKTLKVQFTVDENDKQPPYD